MVARRDKNKNPQKLGVVQSTQERKKYNKGGGGVLASRDWAGKVGKIQGTPSSASKDTPRKKSWELVGGVVVNPGFTGFCRFSHLYLAPF